MKTAVSAVMVWALCCATPAMAQNHDRGPTRCAPGDPNCGTPAARNDRGPGNETGNSVGNGVGNGSGNGNANREWRGATPQRPPMPAHANDRAWDQNARRQDRNDRFDRYDNADRFGRNDRSDGFDRQEQRFQRGDRVPQDYRGKQYVVDDWQGHGLRRPPRGYQWVQNGGDYLLVAITTGIILELLLGH